MDRSWAQGPLLPLVLTRQFRRVGSGREVVRTPTILARQYCWILTNSNGGENLLDPAIGYDSLALT